MNKKTKGDHEDRQSLEPNKDSKKLHIHQKIRGLFLNGGRYTASELNSICGGNDARKVISILRNKELLNIKDIRLDDNRKLYWLSPIRKKGGEE